VKLLSGVDDHLADFAELCGTAGLFGMVRSGWGEMVAWRRDMFVQVMAAVDEAADRMAASLAAAEVLITAYDNLPAKGYTEQKFRLLQQAERLLTTTPTSPPPAKPESLRFTVASRRLDFKNRLAGLRDIAKTSRTTLSALLSDVRKLLPLTPFDPIGLDLTPFEDRVVAFCTDLHGRAERTHAEVLGRLAAADKALAAYDQAAPGPDRVAAGTDALRAMLGADALVFPAFRLPDAMVDEWNDALDETGSGRPTKHMDRDFPVDDWLHGVSRVREKPRLWERVTLLAGALDRPEPALTPAQFPYKKNAPWLALELPAGHVVDGDRLLYTAHYTEHLRRDRPLCGVLLDEWTETLPAKTETTGIAFHYDRPGTEPPQAMLLVAPPRRTGTWAWDDLVAALHDTLELAKARAVEPTQIDATDYAPLLPTTVLTSTRRPITISTDLVRNNLGQDSS
jgi:hypothetical protein